MATGPGRQRGRLQRSARSRAHVPAPGLLANDSDPNGDTIFADTFTAPTHGTLTQIVTDGSFIYIPDAGFVGVDTWTYTISDGTNLATGTVTINVTNTAPVAGNDAYSVQEGNTLTVAAPGLLVNDSDADGDTIFAQTFTTPTHGTLTQIVTNGSFIYVPDAGFVGVDTWTYAISATRRAPPVR